MSRPGALRAWVWACATILAAISSPEAQESNGRINLYQSTAAQYRELAAKASGDRRACLLAWAAYYESFAANLRTGSPVTVRPERDRECKKPATAPPPGQSPQPAAPPVPVQSPEAELFDGLRYDMAQATGAAKPPAPELRTKLDAVELILDDVTGAAPERRAQYLDEFLAASAPLVNGTSNPYKIGLLSLRTAAFLELNREEAGRASARQLFEAGAAKSEGATLRQFMAMLERKRWLAQDGAAPAATAPAAATTPASNTAAATTAAATPAAATSSVGTADQNPGSLAGSIWSGTLVALNRNKKEATRYAMDIHFKEGGIGKAIYREFNPVLAWTQSGSRATAKMELVAGCVLSLELISENATLIGVGSWSNVPGNAECVKASGGITLGSTIFTKQLVVPREFSATRVAFAPKNARPTASKPAGAPRNEPVAISRVAPVYPPKAELLSLEGWVVVVFTVAADGTVKDPQVRESTSNLFDEAALAAVSQWRYKPLTNKKGAAIERPGMSVVISFKVPE